MIYNNFFPIKDDTVFTSRFDHLDGYRGFLAILVVLHHCTDHFQLYDNDYKIFAGAGNFVGISGFFVLSAFLHTYLLLKNLEKSTCLKDVCLVVVKYAIKRFFRIYVAFVIFTTTLKLGPEFIGGYFFFGPWYDIISLNR